MLKILEEVFLLESDKAVINNDSSMTLSGVFQKGDEPNANRRVYPMQYLEREVERLLPLCKTRALVGELDHPVFSSASEASTIHMKNASHVITNLTIKGKYVYGDIEVLATPSGLILQEFIRKRVKCGVSSRSLGDVNTGLDGFDYVAENLKIITWDDVVGPSVVESDMQEKKVYREWMVIKEAKERIDGKILNENKKQHYLDDPESLRATIRKVIDDDLGFRR